MRPGIGFNLIAHVDANRTDRRVPAKARADIRAGIPHVCVHVVAADASGVHERDG